MLDYLSVSPYEFRNLLVSIVEEDSLDEYHKDVLNTLRLIFDCTGSVYINNNYYYLVLTPDGMRLINEHGEALLYNQYRDVFYFKNLLIGIGNSCSGIPKIKMGYLNNIYNYYNRNLETSFKSLILGPSMAIVNLDTMETIFKSEVSTTLEFFKSGEVVFEDITGENMLVLHPDGRYLSYDDIESLGFYAPSTLGIKHKYKKDLEFIGTNLKIKSSLSEEDFDRVDEYKVINSPNIKSDTLKVGKLAIHMLKRELLFELDDNYMITESIYNYHNLKSPDKQTIKGIIFNKLLDTRLFHKFALSYIVENNLNAIAKFNTEVIKFGGKPSNTVYNEDTIDGIRYLKLLNPVGLVEYVVLEDKIDVSHRFKS